MLLAVNAEEVLLRCGEVLGGLVSIVKGGRVCKTYLPHRMVVQKPPIACTAVRVVGRVFDVLAEELLRVKEFIAERTVGILVGGQLAVGVHVGEFYWVSASVVGKSATRSRA